VWSYFVELEIAESHTVELDDELPTVLRAGMEGVALEGVQVDGLRLFVMR
jgi:hypothetical protein